MRLQLRSEPFSMFAELIVVIQGFLSPSGFGVMHEIGCGYITHVQSPSPSD